MYSYFGFFKGRISAEVSLVPQSDIIDYQLKYSRGTGSIIYFSKLMEDEKKKFYNTPNFISTSIKRKDTLAYKLSLNDDFLKAKEYNSELIFSLKSTIMDVNKFLYNFDHNEKKKKTKKIGADTFYCNLNFCNIGFLSDCNKIKILVRDFSYTEDCRNTNYFYIGFTESEKYRNFILKLIPKNNYKKYVFSVVFCPNKDWVEKENKIEYSLDDSNLVDTRKLDDYNSYLILKLAHCHNNNENFVKCGRLDQRYMPSIDVGYDCSDYNKKEANKIHNKDEKKTDIIVISNDTLMCNGHNILKSSSRIISILSPENIYNEAGTLNVGAIDKITNLYPEQELQLIDVNDIIKTYPKAGTYLGFVVNFEPKCRVPYLNVKLSLKINDSIQKFQNKVGNTFREIDTYVVDRREMNNAHVGCHLVFSEKKHPAFNDFYENCCQPSLLMLDRKTGKYIEITNIQSLQPNNKYKCALKVKNTNFKSGGKKYIHETDFTIHLIDLSLNDTSSSESNFTVWVIFGVFIIVIILLIIGLIILKKIKKKKSNNNSNSSSSTSQSTTTNTTVISKIFNTPIIKKNINKTCTNMGKTSVTKNLNTNNKVVNFGQKVIAENLNVNVINHTKNIVTKNSNINLVNQAKNAPKNVVAKNSNINLVNQAKNAPKNVVAKNSNINLLNQAKNAPKKIVGKNTNPKKTSNISQIILKIKIFG
uniref:EGF-like domain-containing protein n=1 Tax=Strongyloides venezuelensis TaxID=75913 RepID=A0A0K0EW61_STRVS